MATPPLALLSPTDVWDLIDPLSKDQGADPGDDGLADLPYGKLKGPGFERLCYELLVAEGHSPRFFGRSGQRDYGVDIIVEAGDTRMVYQCKNLAEIPTWSEIRDAVCTFENDWLGEADLPKPDAFVYCCLLAFLNQYLYILTIATHSAKELYTRFLNLAALRYKRGADRSFDGCLPNGVIDILVNILRERVKPKGRNREKLAQLQLAGLLRLLEPGLDARLGSLLEPLAGAVRWLAKEAMAGSIGFVPALFALQSIALLRPGMTVFTPEVRTGLLSKYQEYDDICPAVEHLLERLEGSK